MAYLQFVTILKRIIQKLEAIRECVQDTVQGVIDGLLMIARIFLLGAQNKVVTLVAA